MRVPPERSCIEPGREAEPNSRGALSPGAQPAAGSRAHNHLPGCEHPCLRGGRSEGALHSEFEQGSHIDLPFHDQRIRQYSICSESAKRRHYVFAVQHEAEGPPARTRASSVRRSVGSSRSESPSTIFRRATKRGIICSLREISETARSCRRFTACGRWAARSRCTIAPAPRSVPRFWRR